MVAKLESKGSRSRSLIIESATELFYERGIHQISVREIAAELGITHAAIYRYFADKDELLLGCAEYVVKRAREVIDQGIDLNAPAPERLRAYIRGNVQWFTGSPVEANIVLGTFYFSSADSRIADFHRALIDGSLSRLVTQLTQGAREGCWKMKNLPEKARAIHNLMVGEMIKSLVRPKDYSPPERLALLWNAVEALIQ